MTGDVATPQRRPLRRYVGIAAAALAVGFLGYALVSGWSEVSAFPWHPNWGLLILSGVVILVSYVLTGVAYVAVLDALVDHRPPRRRMLAIWGVSLLGRYVPGSVVMVGGRMELARDQGVPRRATVAAVIYEQILSVGAAAACAAAFVLVYGRIGPEWLGWLVVLLPLGLVVLHPELIGRVLGWVFRRLKREQLPQVIPLRTVAVLAAWYLVAEVVLALGAWLGIRALAGSAVGSPAFVAGAFLFAWVIAMLLIVVPSGLGVREGAFALALTQHVPGSVAVALAVVSRLEVTVVELIAVGIFALVARRS